MSADIAARTPGNRFVSPCCKSAFVLQRFAIVVELTVDAWTDDGEIASKSDSTDEWGAGAVLVQPGKFRCGECRRLFACALRIDQGSRSLGRRKHRPRGHDLWGRRR